MVTAISTFLAGLAFGFGFFWDTPFYIIILFLFYPFTLSMQMLSFFLSTLSPTLKAANAISYGIVLFAIVVESFVSNNNLLVFLFSDDAGGLIIFLKAVLTLYPPFSFTKIFTSIAQYSGSHFDIGARIWEKGPGYTFNDFTKTVVGSLQPMSPGGFTRYPDLVSMLVLLADGLFFIILTFYFDHVVESNRGRGESPLFPIYKITKLFSKSSNNAPSANFNELLIGNSQQDQEESTIRERERVYKNSRSGLPAFGLRIKDLSKTFSKMCSNNRVEAIKGFNL
jgi:hypothetical protein